MRPHVRRLLETINAHARVMYEMGRSDRVRGLPPSILFGEDMYYACAYQSERAKERPYSPR